MRYFRFTTIKFCPQKYSRLGVCGTIDSKAASTAVEAVQDPQRTADEFSEIGTDFNRLADKLEVRGALTEKEARDFVEGVTTQIQEPYRSFTSNIPQHGTA